MQLNVTGHHVEITAALRGYVEKKLERIGRHFDQVIDVHCVLTVEKLRQKAEATLHVSGSAIHADATEAEHVRRHRSAGRQARSLHQEAQGKAHRPPCRRSDARCASDSAARPARASGTCGAPCRWITISRAHHHPQRAVRLRQERGAAHARGPRLLLHRQHPRGAAQAVHLLHGAQRRRPPTSAPRSDSMRATPPPRSPPSRS